MKNMYKVLAIILLFVSCTKDDASETLKYGISGKLIIEDSQNWPTHNQLLEVAIYEQGTQNQVANTTINNTESAEISFIIPNIPAGTYDLSVLVTENSITKSVLYTKSQINLTADVNVNDINITLLTYARIQEQVFNSCLACHGNSNQAAANLYLTEAESYNNLVNVQSVKSNLLRVKPNESTLSFLINVLERSEINFEHSGSYTATEGDIQLVKNWINQGAKN